MKPADVFIAVVAVTSGVGFVGSRRSIAFGVPPAVPATA